MNTEEKTLLPRTSRSAEEQYLKDTRNVIAANIRTYGRDVSQMRSEIDDILEHFHDDNPELINHLENTITMHDHLKRALERNEKAQDKPYFGRIIFYDETLKKLESLYIGKGGISKDSTNWMVIDWRAPVANTYYENGLGKCTYPSPDGSLLPIDLKLKRTYEIEKGTLLQYFESEMIANDELLTKYLSKNKQAVLGEIVATIQKEQNDIIRRSPYHNCLVQGVAGSGKTTVAMHRISYILYNYAERFRPDDFYIVGSNRILLNYITGVLPDLDVYGIRQMTMEQLFVRLLYEDWDEKRYQIKEASKADESAALKGSLSWFRALEAYCRNLEWQTIPRESVYLNPKQFVEGIRDGQVGVFDDTEGLPADPADLVLLADKDAIVRYIQQNPKVSVQSKIQMLNERLDTKIKEEFLIRGNRYTEYERKAIRKAFRGHFGGRKWKTSIFTLYQEFLKLQQDRGYGVTLPHGEFDVYDLAALAYLYKRIKETEVISEAHHVVIDEAQDFGMMAYSVLHFCIKDCTYTIMGDVSQNIHFGSGLNDWEELRTLYLSDEADSFNLLKKSYRNTVEISNFATNILHHGQFVTYPVEPIIRHGEPVAVQHVASKDRLLAEAARVCRNWQQKGLETIAVICRDPESAEQTAKKLGELIPILEYDLEKASFGNGIMVLPVSYTKGLEFDAVLILDPSAADYPKDDGHAKLLYVAATRALHELCVLHTENLTELMSEPAESNRNRIKTEENTRTQHMKRAEEPAAAKLAASSSKPVLSSKPTTSSKPAAEIPVPAVPRKKAVAALPKTKSGISIALASPVSKPLPTEVPKAVTQPLRESVSRAASPQKAPAPLSIQHRPMGHARIDLSVRWVSKQPDGLSLQSRYGILRLCPVNSNMIRVTFSKTDTQPAKSHPAIKVSKPYRNWMYKESAKTVDLMTDALCLQVDKASGAIRYLTIDRKLLVTERTKECRQAEFLPNGTHKNWLYPDPQKGENWYALHSDFKLGTPLRNTETNLTGLSKDLPFPFLLSDKGYGLIPICDGPVVLSDTTAYGTYLYCEGNAVQDYYFIGGNRPETLIASYCYLLGINRN